MKQTLEKAGENFYCCRYQKSNSDWSTRYYGIFTDWKGRRRKFPLGANEKHARRKLDKIMGDNAVEKDFDAEKVKPQQAMTLKEWLDTYLDLVKDTPSGGTKKAQCLHLKRLLGHLPLSEITRVRVMEYKNRRLAESLIRHGEAIKETRIKGSTVNREVSCLVTALNLAADQGLCEGAPKVKKERETPRERIL